MAAWFASYTPRVGAPSGWGVDAAVAAEQASTLPAAEQRGDSTLIASVSITGRIFDILSRDGIYNGFPLRCGPLRTVRSAKLKPDALYSVVVIGFDYWGTEDAQSNLVGRGRLKTAWVPPMVDAGDFVLGMVKGYTRHGFYVIEQTSPVSNKYAPAIPCAPRSWPRRPASRALEDGEIVDYLLIISEPGTDSCLASLCKLIWAAVWCC